jgi:hypothetical protein
MEVLEKLATFEGAVIFFMALIVYAIASGTEKIVEVLQDIRELILEELND